MAIYPRIKDEERERIPAKDRCSVSYNGYHSFEVVREAPNSVPVMVCPKCQMVVAIDYSRVSLDKSEIGS